MNGTVNGTVNLPKTEQQILKIIENNGNITVEGIAKLTGIAERTIKRCTKSLKDKNFIKRIGSDKSGHWEVL